MTWFLFSLAFCSLFGINLLLYHNMTENSSKENLRLVDQYSFFALLPTFINTQKKHCNGIFYYFYYCLTNIQSLYLLYKPPLLTILGTLSLTYLTRHWRWVFFHLPTSCRSIWLLLSQWEIPTESRVQSMNHSNYLMAGVCLHCHEVHNDSRCKSLAKLLLAAKLWNSLFF